MFWMYQMFKIHHIDIWVNNTNESIKFYQALGFNKIKETKDLEQNKEIIIMELNNILLEIKHHYIGKCEHNKTECNDNKIFGLSVDNIDNAKDFIESKSLTSEKKTMAEVAF